MNTKIICCNLEKNFIFNEGMHLVMKSDDESKKIYYHVGKSSVEVIVSDSEELRKVEKYIHKNDKIIIILENIDDDNISHLSNYLEYKNITFIVGSKNELSKSISECLVGKIIYLPQLMMSDERIHISSLLMLISNEENISNESSLILGRIDSKKSSSEIALFILKRFQYVQRLNNFKLYIFNNNEFGIDKLSYLKDPLLEYLNKGSVLQIKQLKQDSYVDNIYFSLMCE